MGEAARHGQAKTGALSESLRGEEWLHRAIDCSAVHAAPVSATTIRKYWPGCKARSSRPCGNCSLIAAKVIAPSPSIASREFAREIDEDCLELALVNENCRQSVLCLHMQRDVRSKGMSQDFAQSAQYWRDFDRFRLQIAAARQREQAFSDRGGARGRFRHHRRVAAHLFWIVGVASYDAGRSGDGLRYIVEVMRNPARQLAERAELFSLGEAGVRRLAGPTASRHTFLKRCIEPFQLGLRLASFCDVIQPAR